MARRSSGQEVEEEIAITTREVKRKPRKTTRKRKVEEEPTPRKTRKPRTVERAAKSVKKNKKAIKEQESFIEQIAASPSGEQEYIKEYLFLYKRLKRLVRKAERKSMESGQSRDYYAFCTLVSQQREVIADLRSISDLSGQVQMLLEQALQPMVSQMGQAIVNSFYQQRRLILETSKEKETQFAIKKLDEITGDVSKALQVYYEQAAVKIHEVLVGVPEDTKPKRKRRA